MNKDIIQVNSFFMANEKARKKVNGRLYFDYAVLTIHKERTEHQLNNICWLEENVLNNIDSAKDMPLVAQFIDCDKSVPYGHGYPTKIDEKVVILDSEQVGSVVDAEIRNVVINKDNEQEEVRVLVSTGYINEIRYPELAKWLKSKMFDGEPISTSVEIIPKKGNQEIVYEIANNSQGEQISIPVEFDFAGSAILSIQPADSNAIVLEINSAKEQKQKEDKEMEKLLEELASLKTQIEEKDLKINELETKNEEVTALEEKVETLSNEKETLETEKAELDAKVEELTSENASLSEFKEEKEKEEIKENFEKEVEIFSDELKEEVKTEIEEFENEPTLEKAEAIINSLNAKFVKNSLAEKENEDKEKKDLEIRTNSLFTSVENSEEEKPTDSIKVWED